MHGQNHFKRTKVIFFLITKYKFVLCKGKGNAVPFTGLEWPRGFQEVKVPRSHDNSTRWWQGCRPYAPAAFTPQEMFLVLISVRG